MVKIFEKLMVLLDRQQKRKMVLLVFLMLIGAVLETLGVSMILPVMNVVLEEDAIAQHEYLQLICRIFHIDNSNDLTILVMIGLVLVFIVKNIFLFFQQKVQLKFVYTNQFATSRRMMINFMQRPYEYYLNADTAVIQRNITSDVNNMYGLILALLQLISEGIVFVCLAAVSLVADVWMSLTVTALLVIALLVIKCILKPIMRRAGEENQDFYSGLYKWIDQSVMGIKEIKIARRERYFINEYSKCGAGYVSAVQRYNLYNATPRLLIETLAIAGMILYLMIQLLQGTAAADIVPQLGLLAVAAMRLIPCANRINNHLTSISYFEPFFMGVSDNLQEEIRDENVDYSAETYLRKEEVEKLPVRKEIVLQDITYKYPNSETLIFDHAEMKIPIGKSVGIVGTSGAGKTTIVNLISRFYDVQEGIVSIDGYDIKKVSIESLRRQMGIMTQDNFLFTGTIKENIRYGKLDATDEEIIEAAKAVHAHDFICRLEKGYDTMLTERGGGLSVGQKQLLAFARTMVSRPNILILDEATSSIDTNTELLVQDGIDVLLKGRTSFVIAHRLSTIQKADRIFVIDNGGIVEQGSAAELMAKKGAYYRLHNAQLMTV